MNPRNGFAKSHLGFILKTDHLRYTEAIPLLRGGISSGDPGADDGRFYFHLGDALTRVGKPDEVILSSLSECCNKIYEVEGVHHIFYGEKAVLRLSKRGSCDAMSHPCSNVA